jgi:hypothetical protein
MNHPLTWPVSDGQQLSSVEIGGSIDEGIVADYSHEVHVAIKNFFCFGITKKETDRGERGKNRG